MQIFIGGDLLEMFTYHSWPVHHVEGTLMDEVATQTRCEVALLFSFVKPLGHPKGSARVQKGPRILATLGSNHRRGAAPQVLQGARRLCVLATRKRNATLRGKATSFSALKNKCSTAFESLTKSSLEGCCFRGSDKLCSKEQEHLNLQVRVVSL